MELLTYFFRDSIDKKIFCILNLFQFLIKVSINCLPRLSWSGAWTLAIISCINSSKVATVLFISMVYVHDNVGITFIPLIRRETQAGLKFFLKTLHSASPFFGCTRLGAIDIWLHIVSELFKLADISCIFKGYVQSGYLKSPSVTQNPFSKMKCKCSKA